MKMLALLLLLMPIAAKAQTTPPKELQALEQWIGSQQAHVGTGFGINGVKYGSTWWDLVSVGEAGLNIGKAGSLDFVDVGPVLSMANTLSPRYGASIPIHAGNIWNSLKLPSNIVTHVWMASLPNITLAPAVFYPQGQAFNKWTWKNDFQLVLAYTFGGS